MRRIVVASAVVSMAIWWSAAPAPAGGVVDVSVGQGVAVVAGRSRSAVPAARSVSLAIGRRWGPPGQSVRLRAHHLWFRLGAAAREVEQSVGGLSLEVERSLGRGFGLGAGAGVAFIGGASLERKTGLGPAASVRPSYALIGARARLRAFGEASVVALQSGRVIGLTLGVEAAWGR